MKSGQYSNNQVDILLWTRLKTGDEHALALLVKKFFNPLLNYGYQFVKDKEFVRDCVQEIFIEIWQRRERISTPESVKAYLLSAVRKRVLREGYRQHIYRNQEISHENENSLIDFSAEWAIIEQENTAEMQEKVRQSISRLSKRQQEVLYLQYYQGLGRDEIADIMNINTQSVSNLIQSAFRSFREYWQTFVLLAGVSGLIIFQLKQSIFSGHMPSE